MYAYTERDSGLARDREIERDWRGRSVDDQVRRGGVQVCRDVVGDAYH